MIGLTGLQVSLRPQASPLPHSGTTSFPHMPKHARSFNGRVVDIP